MLKCAVYELGRRPEYIQPLLEEIVEVIREEGWTKAAFAKMWKLDSFLRETQRCHDMQMRKSYICIQKVND